MQEYKNMKNTFVSLAIVSLAVAAGTAQAGYTSITGNGVSGASTETPGLPSGLNPSLQNILALTYGGSTPGFFGTATLDLNLRDFTIRNSGGTVVAIARRVEDFIGGSGSTAGTNLAIQNGASAGTTDQIWTDSVVATTARAVFAGDRQFLSTLVGTGPYAGSGADLRLGNFGPDGFNPATTYYGVSPRMVPASPFQWMLSDSASQTGLDYSRMANNGGRDQMVTYEILGPGASLFGGVRRYVIAFEDRQGGDRDFNDLVVEVAVAVPLPPAAYAGLGTLGLAGFGAFIRRRRLSANA